jgi:hypothetical protein
MTTMTPERRSEIARRAGLQCQRNRRAKAKES